MDSNRQALGDLDVANHATFPLALNWAVTDLKDISRRTGSYSKTFKVPATKNNNRLLQYIYKSHLVYDEVVYGNRATVLVGGLPVFDGKIRVKSLSQADNPESYELELAGDNLDWVYLLKDKSIRDIELGNEAATFTRTDGDTRVVPATQHSHVFNRDMVEASWHHFPAAFDYVYGLKNYGAWTHRDYVSLEEMRPDVSIRKLFLQSLQNAGYRVESDFWDSAFARKLVLAYTGDNFRLPADSNDDMLFEANNTSVMNFGGHPGGYQGTGNIYLDNAVSGQFDTVNYKYVSTRRCKMRFRAKVDLEVTKKWENLIDLSLYIGVAIGPNSWDEPVVETVTLDGNREYTVELDSGWLLLDAGEEVVLRYRFETDRYFLSSKAPAFEFQQMMLSNEVETEIREGDTYNVASTLPDVSQLDILSALANLFNLYFKTDVVNKLIYCEPKEQFFKETQEAVDWSQKLDLNHELTTEYIDSYKRNLIFQYKNDSGDGYDKAWRKENEQVAGSLEYELPERYAQGDNKLDNKLFAYSHIFKDETIRIPGFAAPQMPRLWKDNEAVPAASYDFEPRILLYEGVGVHYETGYYGQPIPMAWNWLSTGTPTVTLPRLSNTALGFDKADGLVATYYQKDVAQLVDGRMVHAWFYLNTTDMLTLDLRRPVWIDHPSYRGYYYINKVVDHQPLLDNTTKVELIPADITTEVAIDYNDNVDVRAPKLGTGLGIATGDATYTGAGKTGSYLEHPSVVLNNGTANWASGGSGSVVMGNGLVATGKGQHLYGSWNVQSDTDHFQLGLGSGEHDRYRGLTLTQDGNFLVQGGYLYTRDGREILFASVRNIQGTATRLDKLHLKGDQ